jgi:hypothetical protein
MSQDHSNTSIQGKGEVDELRDMSHEDLVHEAIKEHGRIKALGAGIICLIHESEADTSKESELGEHVEHLVEISLKITDRVDDITQELGARLKFS